MEEEYTAEEALELVRAMEFPAAVDGDTLTQWGHQFVLNGDQWNHLSDSA
jgi:hypothetical protein